MSALKELGHALVENVAKAPGWLPLLILCYLGFMLVPEGATLLGFPLKAHEEIVVPAVTLVLFVLGDLLDKPLFGPLTDKWLKGDRRTAKEALKVEKGIYRVSMALGTASKRPMRRWIQAKNESAKFLRSLVLPTAVMGIVLLIRSQVALGIAAVAGAFVFFPLYIWLKASHIKDLYRLSAELCKDHKKYYAHDLREGRVRLFFWEGELVGSANRPDPVQDEAPVSTTGA